MPNQSRAPSRRSYLWLNTGVVAVATIVYGIWFARISASARTQREAVAAIRHAGGTVRYEADPKPASGGVDADPPFKPGWVERLLGTDYTRDVVDAALKRDADALMPQIGRLAHLRELDLSANKVSDAGLAHLKGLPWLKRLNLAYTPVSDSELTHLTSLKDLRELNLSGTAVTNQGLVQLRGLPHLELLVARDTAITADGAKELQNYLPRVSVNRSKER